MISGHLLHKGIHVPWRCIRASYHWIDSEGVAERKSEAIRRRVYCVPHPNHVWHIDDNHKLIKWCLWFLVELMGTLDSLHS